MNNVSCEIWQPYFSSLKKTIIFEASVMFPLNAYQREVEQTSTLRECSVRVLFWRAVCLAVDPTRPAARWTLRQNRRCVTGRDPTGSRYNGKPAALSLDTAAPGGCPVFSRSLWVPDGELFRRFFPARRTCLAVASLPCWLRWEYSARSRLR